MLKRLNKEELTTELCNVIVDKLDNKLDIFRYDTKENYIKSLYMDDCIIFMGEDIVLPCRFIVYPTGLKGLSIDVVKFGDKEDTLDQLLEAEAFLANFAKSIGVDVINISGRKGWNKILPGYQVEKTIIYKLL